MKRRDFCTFLAVGVALAPTVALGQPGYQTYANARFNYRISYPADFAPQEEAPNGDGRKFTSTDGAELAVWGSNNALDRAIAEEADADYEFLLKERFPGSAITYKTRGKNFYVYSGTVGDKIFYWKKIHRGNTIVAFEFVYPAAKRARYDTATKVIAKSFKG
jgi:hypothetical protein